MHVVADIQSVGRGTSLLWINACHGWIGLQPLESPALSPYCPSLYCVRMLQTGASLCIKIHYYGITSFTHVYLLE